MTYISLFCIGMHLISCRLCFTYNDLADNIVNAWEYFELWQEYLTRLHYQANHKVIRFNDLHMQQQLQIKAASVTFQVIGVGVKKSMSGLSERSQRGVTEAEAFYRMSKLTLLKSYCILKFAILVGYLIEKLTKLTLTF